MSYSTIDKSYSVDKDGRFLRLLDDLALIQWAAGRFETVDPGLTQEDFVEISMAKQLLGGNALVGTWSDVTFTVSDEASPEIRRLWTKDAFRIAVSSADAYTARIAGREYRLGRGVMWVVDSATMAPEHDEWRTDGPPPGASVRMVPKESDLVRRWLLTEGVVDADVLEDAGP